MDHELYIMLARLQQSMDYIVAHIQKKTGGDVEETPPPPPSPNPIEEIEL